MINMCLYIAPKFDYMKATKVILLLMVCTVFYNCSSTEKPATHTNSVFDEDSAVPVDFMDFYMKFHQDSAYQMEHIQFPLRGMPAMAIDLPQDSINNFTWDKEAWKIHKPFMGNKDEYLKEFRVVNENLISEFIVEKQMGYGMERRFSKLANRWYLIYYMDMNKME